MLAIANDHLSTARLLVLYGANARVRDLLGKSALDYAQPGQNEAIRAEVFGGRGFRRF
jgi:ankyrin repeat protein